MSRSTLYIIGALLLGIGALLFVGRIRTTVIVAPTPVVTTAPAVDPGNYIESNYRSSNIVVLPVLVTSPTSPPTVIGITPAPADPEAVAKIAALERDYLAAITQDDRMDVVNNLGEIVSGETVKSLARLFEQEKDKDLQVHLVDALQSISGFKEEKLAFLATAIRPALDRDVRQAAIDGLIDLEHRRSIRVLQPLLNDADDTIVQAAKSAIFILESPLTPPLSDPLNPPPSDP
jgi:hypothetical protein